MKTIIHTTPARQQPDNRKEQQKDSLHQQRIFGSYLTSEEARKKSRENLDNLCRVYGILE